MSDEEMERRPDAVVERLRMLTNELESLASDRGLISALSPAERTRLFNAAGNLFEPDVARRRQSGKAARRRAKASKLERDEAVLSETGIRVLREKPVFTSPNVFAPSAFEQVDVDDDPGFRDLVESRHCYVCKRHYSRFTISTTSCARSAATSTSASAPRPPTSRGRVALLTGGRVKIGYQAGIKLLRAGARLIVTTRFPRDSAARYAREPDFGEWGDRLEIYGLDLRHTPSVEAFCRHLLDTRAAPRLHHQQRLPDRAPPARVLRAHDGRRDGPRGRDARSRSHAARRVRGTARVQMLLAASCSRGRADRRHRGRPSSRKWRCCRRNSPQRATLPGRPLDQDLQQ